MADRAISVEQSAMADARKRRVAWTVISTSLLVLIDIAVAIAAFILAFKFRNQAPLFRYRRSAIMHLGVSQWFQPYFTILLFVPFIKLLSLRRFGLYRSRGEFSFQGDFASVFKASTLSFLVLVLVAFLFRQGFTIENGKLTYLDFSYSRLVFVVDWVASVVMYCMVRAGFRTAQVFLRSTGRNLIPTVVVGCGHMAQICVAEMSEKTRLGYKLVGVVTADSADEIEPIKGLGGRVLGNFGGLPGLVKRFAIEEVWITDTRINPSKLFEVLMECGRDHHIKYRVMPNLFDCMPGKTEIATIGALPMIKLYEEPLRGPQRALKRGMDVLVSGLVFLLTWPLWTALAILIKLESRGPVFYRQERVGMDGKLFLMVKFRSMRDGADDEAHRSVMSKMLQGEEANQGTEESPVYGKVKDDPRLTKLGKWMRRYSIDELPQVINVLRGEMSWVGPRPPIPYEVRLYKDWHRARFHVKPGITGLWQVSGRNRLHFEEMVTLDVFYIENWSPWLDLKIMFKTLPVVMRGDNPN